MDDDEISSEGLRRLVPEPALAERWLHSPRTLQRWRREGRMPPAIVIGRRVFYRPRDIELFERRMLPGGPSEDRR